ncbi:hypothetical protein HDU97_001875 [Phlyctochytrium planicorne]|nr:hypothetical protein HDU97_001875 [Phlyctochytrium planicorne]
MACDLMPPQMASQFRDKDSSSVFSSSPVKPPGSQGQRLDPSVADGFLVIAKGLGLRPVLLTFLKLHADKKNLVFLINSTGKELESFKEDVIAAAVEYGAMSDIVVDPMHFHIINNETPAAERAAIYVAGGLVSITSRILVVDMLNGTVPMHLITGILVNNAHKVSESSTEAFILRLLRDSNKAAFIKAFSDSPELLTSGVWKLEKTMKTLFLRKSDRFQMTVAETIDASGQIELAEVRVPMTDKMRKIQSAIVQCIDASLTDLKKSNRTIDPDELTVENALFKSFDVVIRSQLDPFWHKIGTRTKQIISDLATLRRLLSYVGSYDCVTFYSFLDTIRAANKPTAAVGLYPDSSQSPWLLLDSADAVFSQARARVYRRREEDEPEGEGDDHFPWLPPTLAPSLEEQPKWKVLIDILREIELERRALLSSANAGAVGPVLIMAESDRTCKQIQQILEGADLMTIKPEDDTEAGLFESTSMASRASKSRRRQRPASASSLAEPPPKKINTPKSKYCSPGSKDLLKRLLFNYMRWKGKTPGSSNGSAGGSGSKPNPGTGAGSGNATKNYRNERGRGGSTSHIRRRTRGASSSAKNSSTSGDSGNRHKDESAELEEFIQGEFQRDQRESDRDNSTNTKFFSSKPSNFDTSIVETEFLEHFSLIEEPTILVRPYALSSSAVSNTSSNSGEEDSRILEMLRPQWIVMYDPDVGFVRRIEVFKAMNPSIPVKVYFMIYDNSIEEQKYLSFIRKEKSSFERLIREKSTMAIPIDQDGRVDIDPEEQFWRNLDTRVAGGQRIPASESRLVVVDVREFRSALPSLLHSRRLTLRPCTLEVGDYIISSNMCVERKSIPDLISSLRSGRLYNQVEAMCLHYKVPILLIEFAQGKAFSLGMDALGGGTGTGTDANEINSKLALLMVSFPKLRTIWSSSPAATAEIFEDLKKDQPEPDMAVAMSIGVDSQDTSESVWSITPSDMIRTLPGINSKNYRFVMSKIPNFRALGDISEEDLEKIIGTEAAKELIRPSICQKRTHYKRHQYHRHPPADHLPPDAEAILRDYIIHHPDVTIPYLDRRNVANPKPPYDLQEITEPLKVLAVSMTGYGVCVGKDGWIVLVPTVLQGEVVVGKVFSSWGGVSLADLVRVDERSERRVEPKCKHFVTCSGCQFQHLGYENQLLMKKSAVEKHFKKVPVLLGLDTEGQLSLEKLLADALVKDVMPSPKEFNYRNKIQPHCRSIRANEKIRGIGFLQRGRIGEVVDVDRCEIASDVINETLTQVREQHLSQVHATDQLSKSFLIRGTLVDKDEASSSAAEQTGKEPFPARKQNMSRNQHLMALVASLKTESANSLEGAGNTHRAAKFGLDPLQPLPQAWPPNGFDMSAVTSPDATVTDVVNGQLFRWPANVFFQVNSYVLGHLTHHVRKELQTHAIPNGVTTLVDAYCGTGLFALQCSYDFKKVIGLEIDPTAIRWAKRNAMDNNIKNARFEAGMVSNIFSTVEVTENPDNVAVVVDPSKSGCGPEVMQRMMRFNPKVIIYVSCNVATQISDLLYMDKCIRDGVPDLPNKKLSPLDASKKRISLSSPEPPRVLFIGGKKIEIQPNGRVVSSSNKPAKVKGYRIANIQPVDLFPQTGNIENVVTLIREE